ncbi:MAG: flagellar type III secretion system pore protein FliP [Ruegeria sp.]
MRDFAWLVVLGLSLTVIPSLATAQEVTLSLGDGGSVSARAVQLILLVTILSVAPGLVMMVTCFPFLVTVLSILRQAIGLQQAPPNMLIISLALFLTYFVMEPVFSASWSAGVEPLVSERIDVDEAFRLAMDPLRDFMAARIDPDTLAEMADLRKYNSTSGPARDAPLSLLVPSFLLSEVARAFQIGFVIFLPFLVIDLVVAAILMSMGMMMVPPSVVALPFKLAFFVVADGWSLIAGALVRGYFP